MILKLYNFKAVEKKKSALKLQDCAGNPAGAQLHLKISSSILACSEGNHRWDLNVETDEHCTKQL